MINTNEHNDLCVGIDLGTTNSVLATINVKPNNDIVSKVVEMNRAVDMFNAVSGDVKLAQSKKPTLPSCIYYREERNYAPLVGDFAKMQYSLRPHLVAKSIKSQMGKPFAQGLSPDIPDKTPAQISSQILKHMLKEASRIYKCGEITDAVITVPANFDSAMCKATRDAAELAGIKVKNADGSERPVLLSEPNAVVYDLINQIHNGDISYHIIDLSKKRNVMVFDFGGGTLDITLHEIQRREDNNEVLKVDEIATNRYTLLGGDDFDEEIAKAMFERYIKQYSSHPDVVMKLRQNEEVIMPQLRVFAENVKIELNERCGEEYSSGWDDEDENVEIDTGGSMGGIGYAYDDTFSQEELESILDVFFGRELSYEDYHRIDTITNSRNIIYPILDVLKKAEDKFETEGFKVDAVIVNGGMSKFYMVIDRLKEFFGFEPIVALDPDQAVARGAAVYHYYLHKFDQMKDDMRMLGESDSPASMVNIQSTNQDYSGFGIEWGNNILNDSLFLGLKMGNVEMLIPTGAKLPYKSVVKSGFRIEPEQDKIAIPIKSRNLDGTYRTIANGNIRFNRKYPNGAYVSFIIFMGENKVIAMQAWTSQDAAGEEKIEEGYAEISIDNRENASIRTKIVSKSGSELHPKDEINNVLQLCQNMGKANRNDKGKISKRITAAVNNICAASNKEEFAEEILSALNNVSDTESRLRLFVMARKLGVTWKDSEKKRLASICINELSPVLFGMSIKGTRTNTCIQAIYALGICGSDRQMEKLSVLHKNTQFKQACLYSHAKSATCISWLREEFEKDAKNAIKGHNNNIQFSAYAIGIALRENRTGFIDTNSNEKIVKKLCEVIRAGKLSDSQLVCCILAIGWICDQRHEENQYDGGVVLDALDVINNIDIYYDYLTVEKCNKCRGVAKKLLNGEVLLEDEEEFLLSKLENW